MLDNKYTVQLLWGVLLTAAGCGMIYMIPQKMVGIEKLAYFVPIRFFVRACFYMISIILIGGGLQKVYKNIKEINGGNKDE